MPHPAEIPFGTVTAEFSAIFGSPLVTGAAYFRPCPDVLADGVDNAIYLAHTHEVALVGGALSLTLAATDNPDFQVTDWHWEVYFKLGEGFALKPIKFLLPAGTTVDLADEIK